MSLDEHQENGTTAALQNKPADLFRASRALRTPLAALIAAAVFIAPCVAQAATAILNPTGGTTAANGLKIWAADNGQLQVNRAGAGQVYHPSFVPPHANNFNGMYIAVGSTMYGANSAVASFAHTTFTVVSQGAITGAGTSASPWQVQTVYSAGTTGVQVTLTTSYVLPQQWLYEEVSLSVPVGNTQTIKYYHLIDTFLGGSDAGPALVSPSTGVPSTVGVSQPGILEAFEAPSLPWTHWYSAQYSAMFGQIASGADLLDTVDTNPATDNGIGVEWNLGSAAGTRAFKYKLTFAGGAVGGCFTDSQCTAAQYCDSVTSACKTDLTLGSAIPADHGPCASSAASANATCQSGACSPATNTCAALNGAVCSAAGQCVSGVCNADGKCGDPNGISCASSATCRSDVCNADGKCGDPNGISCASSATCRSDVCNADGKCGDPNGISCASAATCRSSVCDTDGRCGSPNGAGSCTAASAASVCRSGVCGTDGSCGVLDGQGSCTSANAGLVCRSGACGSTSGLCVPAVSGCAADGDCNTSMQWCNISALKCAPKVANGIGIPSDTAHTAPVLAGSCTAATGALTCVSGVCDPRDNKCGFDNIGASACTTASAASVCRSGACSTTGQCRASSACLADGDCSTGWCSISTTTCKPRLPNGDLMPTDAPHVAPTLNASCSPAAASLVCASSACDAADNRCGLVNGTSCSLAAACRSGVCDADSKCGLPVATACTASSQCRSNACVDSLCDGDQDGDGVSDSVERVLRTNPLDTDSDRDGVPDNVELSAMQTGSGPFTAVDSDGDGVIDALDTDDDNDGIPTKDELGEGGFAAALDSDSDGKKDYLDVDDDGDGIPTKDELGAGGFAAALDSDSDGKKDYLDVDDDNDGVPTKDERGAGSAARDSDSDGIKDYLDVDDDGDSVLTKDELGAGGFVAAIDTDADGEKDYLDVDDDGDTLPTLSELGAGGALSAVDSDGDGKKDYLDSDDDNDSILTKQEISDAKAAKLSDDVDSDGKKNWLDTDSDADGIADKAEPTDGSRDGIPDYLQVAGKPVPPQDPSDVDQNNDGSLQGGGIGCSQASTTSQAGMDLGALFGLCALILSRRSAKRQSLTSKIGK
jgi:hypothetical protein